MKKQNKRLQKIFLSSAVALGLGSSIAYGYFDYTKKLPGGVGSHGSTLKLYTGDRAFYDYPTEPIKSHLKIWLDANDKSTLFKDKNCEVPIDYSGENDQDQVLCWKNKGIDKDKGNVYTSNSNTAGLME